MLEVIGLLFHCFWSYRELLTMVFITYVFNFILFVIILVVYEFRLLFIIIFINLFKKSNYGIMEFKHYYFSSVRNYFDKSYLESQKIKFF